MYILIGIIVAFFALSAAVVLPSNVGFRNERSRQHRNIVAEDARLCMDGIYMPIPR